MANGVGLCTMSEPTSRFAAQLDLYRSWLQTVAARLYRHEIDLEVDDMVRQLEASLEASADAAGTTDNPVMHLYQVVSETTINALRQAPSTQADDTAAGPSVDPEVMAKIKTVVVGLPPEHQVAAALYLEGFSRLEMVKITGWSDDEARQRVHGAEKALQESLKAAGIEYAAE